MYSYGPPRMAKQKQDHLLEHTYSIYVRMRDVTLKTCQKRWMIGRSGERGSGISMLAARYDDDDEGDSNMYVVHSISFPPFFVQAFRIVIDSWKFTMLLLYILWDHWPIFMISASNEQLQQQLEYTLLNPDCHSWWISKMQSGHEDTLEERYAIKLCFKLGKNAPETYGMLQTAFGRSCMNRASVFEWLKRFKEGRESVRDDERCGRSKDVKTPDLIGQRVRVRVTMLRF